MVQNLPTQIFHLTLNGQRITGSFDTIEILSMIITFRSDGLFIRLDFILSVKSGKFFPKQPIEIFRAKCSVVPSIFIPATPVCVMSKTFGLSTDTVPYDKGLYTYKTLYKNFKYQLYQKRFSETCITC